MTQLPKSKVRSVGVSNFTVEHVRRLRRAQTPPPPPPFDGELTPSPRQLEAIIQDSGVVPAVNQIERHPRLPEPRLLGYCAAKHIVTTAYSAFGNNPCGLPLLVAAPEVKAVAERLSRVRGEAVTPAQVIVAWATRGHHTVIPKSVTPSRIRENFVDVDIDDDAFDAIKSLGRSPQRFNVPYTCEPSCPLRPSSEDAADPAAPQTTPGGTSTFLATPRKRMPFTRSLSNRHLTM